MSLDIYLIEPVPEGAREPLNHCDSCTCRSDPWSTLFSANITHNLVPIWTAAGVYEALYESEGKIAEAIIPALSLGLVRMKGDPARFRRLNASNGCGTYEGAVPWLDALLRACMDHPKALIRVSR